MLIKLIIILELSLMVNAISMEKNGSDDLKVFKCENNWLENVRRDHVDPRINCTLRLLNYDLEVSFIKFFIHIKILHCNMNN